MQPLPTHKVHGSAKFKLCFRMHHSDKSKYSYLIVHHCASFGASFGALSLWVKVPILFPFQMAYNSTTQERPNVMLPWHRLLPLPSNEGCRHCMSTLKLWKVYGWHWVVWMREVQGNAKDLDVGVYRICWLIMHYWQSRFVSTTKDVGTHENGTGVSLCSPPIIGNLGTSITDASMAQ